MRQVSNKDSVFITAAAEEAKLTSINASWRSCCCKWSYYC